MPTLQKTKNFSVSTELIKDKMAFNDDNELAMRIVGVGLLYHPKIDRRCSRAWTEAVTSRYL